MQINPHLQLAKYKADLADKGLSDAQIELAVKSLPSQPVWSMTTMEFGFWDANRAKLFALMGVYQHNERVHGCIDTIAKAVCNAGCQLMEIDDNAGKSIRIKAGRRGKALSGKRLKKLMKQWGLPQLARKSLNDDDSLVEITDHPMLDALNSADNDQTLHSSLRLMVMNLCVFGVSFFKKIRNGRGVVESYLYLPAYNVTPNRGTDGKITGWFYSSTYGEAVPKLPIDKADMLIVRWPSPTDPHAGGDSPLESALKQIDLFGKMLDWQDWTFSNRGRMDGVFIPKMPDGGSISHEQANAQEKRINDKFRGPGNGRWAVAESPGAFQPLMWPPTDLAALEVEDKVATAVMFALNVPEAFGNNDGNRANLEGSLEQFARFCVAPIIALIETVFNTELKTEFDDTDDIFVFENVIPEDKAFALEEDKVEIQAWQAARAAGDVSGNEYRVQVLGIDEDPELDKEPEPVAPVVPPVPAAPAEVPPTPTKTEPDLTEDTVKPAKADPVAKSFDLMKLNRMVYKGVINRAAAIKIATHELSEPEDYVKDLITFPMTTKAKKKPKLPPVKPPRSGDLEKVIKTQIGKQKSHYLAQCDDAAANALEINAKALAAKILVVDPPAKTPPGEATGADAPAIEDSVAIPAEELAEKKAPEVSDPLPASFTPEGEWNATDAMAYKPYLQIVAERTANDRIRSLVGIGADQDSFSAVPDNLEEAVSKATMNFCESTNATTAKDLNTALNQLRQQIAEGLAQGDPTTMLRQRVMDVFENIDKDRAQVIAKTESSRASHEAQHITAKASGMVKGFKFLTSASCCDECAELDGKEIGLDEQFKDSDYDDSVLPVHPGCRCTMTEILDLGDDDEDEK